MATLLISLDENAGARDCNIRNGAGSTTPADNGNLLVGSFRFSGVTNFWRALLHFELSDLPSGSNIQGATFTLAFDGGAPTVGATYTARRLTQPAWTEAATWNTYDGSNAWVTTGGDFSSTNSATVVYASGTSLAFDVTSMLRDALAAGLDYLDILLSGPEIVDGASNYVNGISSADAAEAERPLLEITYGGPGCVSVDLVEPRRLSVRLTGCCVRRVPSMGYDIVDQGDMPRSEATFTTLAGAAHDPDVVSCIVLAPDGTETTYVYDTDPEVVRDELGVYHLDIDVDQAGRWYHRWVATGFGQAAEQQWFEAREAV